jgi:hypothetical protein
MWASNGEVRRSFGWASKDGLMFADYWFLGYPVSQGLSGGAKIFVSAAF